MGRVAGLMYAYIYTIYDLTWPFYFFWMDAFTSAIVLILSLCPYLFNSFINLFLLKFHSKYINMASPNK